MRALPFVLVHWSDSCQLLGWQDYDTFISGLGQQPLKANCRSVGMLLQETEESVTIIQSVNTSDNIGQGITIPKSAIVSCQSLDIALSRE